MIEELIKKCFWDSLCFIPRSNLDKVTINPLVNEGYAVSLESKYGNGTFYNLTDKGKEIATRQRLEALSQSTIETFLYFFENYVEYHGSEIHESEYEDDISELEGYDFIEHYWEESYDDAWVYYEITDIGKIALRQLKEKIQC